MAGEGSRFLAKGWSTPKPIIELDGIPLFMRAIRSVYMEGIDLKHTFIVRQEHIENFQIDLSIRKYLPDAQIFSVNKTTRGAVETCLIAEKVINDLDGIIVMDCDLEFSSESYKNIIKASLQSDCLRGGALVSFQSNDPRYSYAQVNKDNLVIRTEEKEVISNNALCGAYYFASGKEFKEIAHKLLNEHNIRKPEFYVSLLYNYMLANGDKIELADISHYRSYGTPEELESYL